MADTRIDELRRRLERDPGSRLFAQLAEELRKAGDLPGAVRVARAGLALHPSYHSARLTLGRALLDSGDLRGARAELESALHDAPDNILASRFLAQAREQLGDLKGAAEQYQRTLQIAPGDRQVEQALRAVQARLLAPPAAATDAGPPPPPRQVPPPLPTFAATVPLPVRAPSAAVAPARVPPAPGADAVVGELPETLPVRRAPSPERPVVAPPVGPPPSRPVAPPRPPAPAGATLAGPRESAAAVFAEPIAEAGPAVGAAPEGEWGTKAPFPSSTLAELYYQQGLVDRAKDVYRQLVALDPRNERARSRLHELEQPLAAGDERAARRRALERTIAGLEAVLAVARRR